MKVLVTGHRGYLGAVVVPVLLESGYDVSGYDVDYFGHCTYSHGGPYRAVPTIQKDIRDAVPEDFEGFEAVIHLAALPDAPGQIDSNTLNEVNHKASVRVALAARQAGVSRFLFASSASVYGQGGEEALDETGPLNPQTIYAMTKVMAERDVAGLATGSFSPTFLRLAVLCGLSPRLRLDLMFNRLVALAFTEHRLRLPVRGDAWRAFIHVQDVARALAALLREQRPPLHNQVFNVGSSANNHRVRDLATIVSKLVPESRFEQNPVTELRRESYRLNCDKLARTIPAAVPQWTLARCGEQLLEAFDASALTVEEAARSRYDRVAELATMVADKVLNADLRRDGGLSEGPHGAT